jgi:hypothetical protein
VGGGFYPRPEGRGFTPLLVNEIESGKPQPVCRLLVGPQRALVAVVGNRFELGRRGPDSPVDDSPRGGTKMRPTFVDTVKLPRSRRRRKRPRRSSFKPWPYNDAVSKLRMRAA